MNFAIWVVVFVLIALPMERLLALRPEWERAAVITGIGLALGFALHL